jgi:hypothetical protein
MSELADLLERFRRGAELLATATTGAAGSGLDFKPAEDKWSVRQIVCHLADSEALAGIWFRQIIAEENPTLVSFDQDAWASHLDYQTRKISQALEMFRMLRAANYELLKDQAEDVFRRCGQHSLMGSVTLLAALRGFAEHAESHVKQIQSVRAALKEYKSRQAANS